MYEEEIAALQKIIDESENIVFFGGAGVSTESGIPDFRSEDGLYREKYSYPPERIISHSFFLTNPEVFYRFYKEKMLCLDECGTSETRGAGASREIESGGNTEY